MSDGSLKSDAQDQLKGKYLRLLGWGLKAIREADDLDVAKALAEAFHELPFILATGSPEWEKSFWEYHVVALSEDLRNQVCTHAKEVIGLQPDRFLAYRTLYQLD